MGTEFKKPIPAGQIKEQRLTEEMASEQPTELSGNFEADLQHLRSLFHDSSDLVIRRFRLPIPEDLELAMFYIDGLVDTRVVDQDIMRSLLHLSRMESVAEKLKPGNALDKIKAYLLAAGEIEASGEIKNILHTILSGDTVLLISGSKEAIIVNSRGFETRGVQEPTIEAVVRGPREGFSENIRTNTGLIRRRIKDPDLVVETAIIGRRTGTDIAFLYIKDIANPNIVADIKAQVQNIEIDAVLESGYVEQLVKAHGASLFPQMQATERPDKAAAGILEGRVAIIVDGSPFVLLAPVVWIQFFQSPEDYYEHSWLSSFIRLIRLAATVFSLFLSGIYVALTSFHPEMIPTTLALALAAARTGVPFSLLAEILIMELLVEIIREASVRLPGPIGPTVGIVGGLILGEASVRAGIVSPLTVIVVAITAIGSFATPNQSTAISIRLLRFPFIFLGASFGLIGITAGIILLVIHLAGLESWGIPYMAPYAPYDPTGQGDTVLRRDFLFQRTRPRFLKPLDRYRLPGSGFDKEGRDGTQS